MLVLARRPARRSRGWQCRLARARVADSPRRDRPGQFRALNLAVHRRMRHSRQIRDQCRAQLTIGITEHQRKDLALLRPQDRQERWSRDVYP
jgi:hypothetical protein